MIRLMISDISCDMQHYIVRKKSMKSVMLFINID